MSTTASHDRRSTGVEVDLGLSGSVGSAPTVAESSARLRLDHAEIAAGVARMHDYVRADDLELADPEWTDLEAAVLRHMDAEEMVLLPAFARAAPEVAAEIRAEHGTIRELLGEIGIELDLHALTTVRIEALSAVLSSHMRHEAATVYAWADELPNRPVLEAMARRARARFAPVAAEDRAVATLVGLVRVCRDGERGYRAAQADVERPDARRLLGRLADARATTGAVLRERLRELGVVADKEGSLLGTLHRGWVGTAAVVSVGEEVKLRAVLRACERGEEVAARAYRSALRGEWPAVTRAALVAGREEVERSLAEVRALAATLA